MIKPVVCTALVLGFAASASAGIFSDFDDINRQMSGASVVHNGVFSVVDEDAGLDTYTGHGPAGFGAGTTELGYTPGGSIVAAKISFGLYANDIAMETVSFFAGIGGEYLGASPGTQINGYATFSYDLFSVLSASALAAVLADLADGTINYTVNLHDYPNNIDNVYLKWAFLEIQSEARRVPDGGATLALFGLGLLGVAFARRK